MARTLIVEADGASRGNPGPASYGAVVADAATGEILAELAAGLGVTTNNVAEYQGLIAGLRAAYALDPDAEVEVRMDSKLAVQQMSGAWQIKHPDIRPLAAQARTAFPRAGAVRYTWVPRGENKRADALANLALDDPVAAAEKRAEAEAMIAGFRAAREAVGGSGGGVGGAGEGAGAGGSAGVGQEELPGIADQGGSAPEEARSGAGGLAGRAGERASVPGSGLGDQVGSAGEEKRSGAGGLAGRAGERASVPGSGLGDQIGSAAEDSGAALSVDRSRPVGSAAGSGSGSGSSSSSRSGSDSASTSGSPPSRLPAPDLGPPTTLLLLRHGATPLTAEKRFSGLGDPELSPLGLQQAYAVARRLAARGGVDAIVSSPLQRTVQTAQAAADELGLAIEVDAGFRETDFGLWDGHTFGEVRERWPAEHRAWLASTAVAPPGGESFDDVAARVLAARDGLLERYARRTVLVVSHVTPIKTLIRDALGAPPESLYAMELSAASLSVVTCYADGRCSMRLFNDTAHLTG